MYRKGNCYYPSLILSEWLTTQSDCYGPGHVALIIDSQSVEVNERR